MTEQAADQTAKVHHLILSKGVDAARGLFDPREVDAAYQVMSDEEQRINYLHAGFAMTSLPHRRPMEADEDGGEREKDVWVRQSGPVRLLVESGRDPEDKSERPRKVGVPYGPIARMILLYLQTEAVKTQSREVELGRSMNQWMRAMGIDNGGKNYKMMREQSKRIGLCTLTFHFDRGDGSVPIGVGFENASFVTGGFLLTQQAGIEERQMTLFSDKVTLHEKYYEHLLKHPLPVREVAIKELGNRSQSMDIYIWLAYRLHQLPAERSISWRALYEQFGLQYATMGKFKENFVPALRLALAVYPEANVEISTRGLVLKPSEPPVPLIKPRVVEIHAPRTTIGLAKTTAA